MRALRCPNTSAATRAPTIRAPCRSKACCTRSTTPIARRSASCSSTTSSAEIRRDSRRCSRGRRLIPPHGAKVAAEALQEFLHRRLPLLWLLREGSVSAARERRQLDELALAAGRPEGLEPLPGNLRS